MVDQHIDRHPSATTLEQLDGVHAQCIDAVALSMSTPSSVRCRIIVDELIRLTASTVQRSVALVKPRHDSVLIGESRPLDPADLRSRGACARNAPANDCRSRRTILPRLWRHCRMVTTAADRCDHSDVVERQLSPRDQRDMRPNTSPTEPRDRHPTRLRRLG